LDIHEYQAKKILSSYGVQILDGELALNTSEAVAAFNKLNSDICVVKAQVHSGARGKAGGIVLCKTDQEVKDASDKLFGTYLKTIQTGDEGKIIERLYIESGCDIDREIYLAFVMDRASQRIVMVASAEGGMSIEELAIEKPDSIKKI